MKYSSNSCTGANAARVDPKVRLAAAIYLRRLNRIDHPNGKFDKTGRWYPDASEGLDTGRIRAPSRTWPYSYLLACRTIRHCAKLAGVPQMATAVRREARWITAETILIGHTLEMHTDMILSGEI